MGPVGADPRWGQMTDKAVSRWQIWTALLVAVGSLATIAYAVVETFWG